MTEDRFCTTQSLDAGEPLYATAGHYNVFLLVEWNQPFGAKADLDFIAQEFAGNLASRWQALWESLPNPRLQVVKQPGGTRADGITVFVAVPHEHNPLLYEFHLDAYEAILDLNFAALLRGEAAERAAIREKPLILICTNTQRDACCGRLGVPIYTALKPLAGEALWQTSHIGGHRFAGTLIIFPHGLYYGRLHSQDAIQIFQRYMEGEIRLENYRGRACYTPIQQAAEYHLRQQIGSAGLESLSLVEDIDRGGGVHTLTFKSTLDGARYHMAIRETLSTFLIPASCGDMPKAVPIFDVE